MRILNLAVDFEKIVRNRLKRVQLPEANKRTRVASAEEVIAIQAVADRETWRIMEVALHTGLREARSWMNLRDDGWWLVLPPLQKVLKGTPQELPLNRIAVAALKSGVSPIDGPIFLRRTSDALNKAWSRICKRTKAHDLHFHDLAIRSARFYRISCPARCPSTRTLGSASTVLRSTSIDGV